MFVPSVMSLEQSILYSKSYFQNINELFTNCYIYGIIFIYIVFYGDSV